MRRQTKRKVILEEISEMKKIDVLEYQVNHNGSGILCMFLVFKIWSSVVCSKLYSYI